MIAPPPLVPPEVDLRDFKFMALDVVKLRDSALVIKATGDEFRAAVLLWCASWHQVPAASLPDEDDELAHLCGYTRAPKEWAQIKTGALRGWVKCSDGRLYHPTVAGKANEAWKAKLEQRERTKAAREKRADNRKPKGDDQPQPLSQMGGRSVTDHVAVSATESKGQGQGQGEKETAGSPEASEFVPTSPASAVKPAAQRGSRLASDWALTGAWVREGAKARAQSGLPPLSDREMQAEGEKFRDHWRAKAGKDATKVDWLATWRNWCRRANVPRFSSSVSAPQEMRTITPEDLGL